MVSSATVCVSLAMLLHLSDAVTVLTAGQTGKITCGIIGKYSFPEWVKDATLTISYQGLPLIHPTLSDRFSFDPMNNRSLTISNVQTSDAGSYVCTHLGGTNAQQTIIVKGEGMANLTLPTSVNCGDQAVLTCTSTDCNDEGYRFIRDGVTIYNNGGPQPGADPGRYSATVTSASQVLLTITNIQLSDAGAYQCTCGFNTHSAQHTLRYECNAVSKAEITTNKKLGITIDRLYPRPSSIVTSLIHPPSLLPGTYTCGPSPTSASHFRCTWNSTISLPDGNQRYTITVTTGTQASSVSGSFMIVTPTSPTISNLVTVDNSRHVLRGVQDTPLTIQCVSRGGIPAPTLAWYKGNTSTFPLAQSTTSDLVQELDGTHTVTLTYMFTPRRTDDMTACLCRVFYPGATTGASPDPNPTSAFLYLDISAVIIPFANITAVEGELNFALTCSATSKPPAAFTWFKGSTVLSSGTGTLTDNSFSYVVPRVNRADAGSYRCQAGNNVGVQDSDVVYLRIKYQPTVTVSTSTSPPYSVTCTAEGYPDNYTYQDWVQIWPGYGPVATIPFTGTTLTFADPTYEISGLYVCGASNGVFVYGTNLASVKANGTLSAHVAPVLIDPPASVFKTQVAGEEGKNVSTFIKYWSNTIGSVVRCYKRVKGSRSPFSRCYVLETETKVTLPVYNHMVSQTGTLARVTIPIKTKDDLGDYDVVVTNAEDGEAVLKVFISLPGPPSFPTLTRIDHLPNGVILSVTPGFHGGYSQTIVAQTSTDRVTWDNITSMNIGQNEQPVILTSNNIQIRTFYFVRAFAFNIEGRSRDFSKIMNVTRNNELDEQHSETTACIAITAAVTACIVLVSNVLIITCVCRGCPNCLERMFHVFRVSKDKGLLRKVPPSDVLNHPKNQHVVSDLESKYPKSDVSQNEPTTAYESLHERDLHSVYMELQ